MDGLYDFATGAVELLRVDDSDLDFSIYNNGVRASDENRERSERARRHYRKSVSYRRKVFIWWISMSMPKVRMS